MSLPVFVWVLDHSEATLGARLVLLVLAEHAHDNGCESYPALDTIARRTRLSRKGARDALRRLAGEGHIQSDGLGPQGQTKWRVVMGGVVATPGEVAGFEGVKLTASEREVTTPEPTTEPSEEPSELPRPRSAADEDSEQTVALCDLLHSLIVGNDPKATPASTSRAWRDAARLLLERDCRDFEQAQRVVRWSQADSFWRSNILSMPKLREKYPQLLLRMGGTESAALLQSERISKTSSDEWSLWADENLPEFPRGQVASAAAMVDYAGQDVTADTVRARLIARYPDLREVSS